MYSALLYKEWLKLRTTFVGLVLLSMLVLAYIALNLAYYNEFMTPKGFWGNVIFLGFRFFVEIKYIPLIAGVVLALVQFVPEMNLSRLKLTLHLPVEENKLLFQMMSIGFILLVSLYVMITLIMWIIVGIYFPSEIINFVLNPLLLWLLGGLSSYFLISAVILEPVWSRRLVMLPFALGFINFFFTSEDPTTGLLIFLILAAVFTALLIPFSGYHFKRGIK